MLHQFTDIVQTDCNSHRKNISIDFFLHRVNPFPSIGCAWKTQLLDTYPNPPGLARVTSLPGYQPHEERIRRLIHHSNAWVHHLSSVSLTNVYPDIVHPRHSQIWNVPIWDWHIQVQATIQRVLLGFGHREQANMDTMRELYQLLQAGTEAFP